MHFKDMIGMAALAGLLAACGGGASAPPAGSGAALQLKVAGLRADTGVPGLAVVVVDHDRVDVATSGVRRVGEPGVIERDDAFQLGSETKAVTATLLARFVEQGRLRWDATLGEVFPAWRDRIQPAYRNVTVAQLLRHRAGLPRDFDDAAFAALQGMLTGDPGADRAAAGLWFLQQPPAIVPGSAMVYSNIGYMIAGLIAEAVGGAPYEQLAARDVLQPLQLAGRFGMPEDAGGATPVGHVPAAAGWQPIRYNPDLGTEALFRQWLFALDAAGGLSMSAPDCGRFLREQLYGLQGRSTYLKQADVALMHTPVDGYGFGWGVVDVPGVGRASLHSGSAGTYYVTNRVIPARNRAVAVMCNCRGADAARRIEAFADTLALE